MSLAATGVILEQPATTQGPPTPGRYRVLVTSTIAFTLMFAVWLQFGILGLPIQKEFGLSDTAFYWLTALPVLNGAIWRLGTGILADRWGGRIVMTGLLLLAAVPTYLLAGTHNPTMLFVLAFLIGFAGNSFSSGIAWNSAWFPRSQQGFALGVFGAGNVGASVTKLIGPAIIAGTAGAAYFGGFVSGGWRLVPVIYAVALVIMAAVLWFVAPKPDRTPGKTIPLRVQLLPLKHLRVWRFSLYYVAVFGAYVALSSALPKYYETQYGVELWQAGLLTALFIFPASLLRPVGGWMSDKVGARRIMYWTFGLMLVAVLISQRFHHIVLQTPTVPESSPGTSASGSPSSSPARLLDGHRQGGRLQAHPGVLPPGRRCRRRSGRDARRARRLLPAAGLRLRRRAHGDPHRAVRRAVPADAGLHALDAPHRRPHAPPQRTRPDR
jgi:NNP family nitrate/nitrite transporter-like MFS transporter